MIIEVILLISSFPVGFLIAWFARDELKDGRVWFGILIVSSFFLGTFFYFSEKISVTLASIFIVIVSSISLIKSYDKTWTRKRI